MPLSNQELQRRAELLSEIEETEARIKVLNEASAVASGDELRTIQQRLSSEKETVGFRKTEIQQLNQILDADEAIARESERAAKAAAAESKERKKIQSTFAKLSPQVKDLLGAQERGNSVINSSTSVLIQLKREEAGLSEADLDLNLEKQAIFTNLQTSLIQQAKETNKAKQSAKGIKDEVQERLEFEASISQMLPSERDMALDMYDQTVLLRKEKERINFLQEQQNGLIEALPGPLGSMVGFAKKLNAAMAANPMFALLLVAVALLGVIVSSFTKLDDAAADFRKETGLTNSQTKEINDSAKSIAAQYAYIGVEAKDVFDTVSALKEEMGDIVQYSDATVSGLTVLGKNFGIAAKDSAKVNSMMQSIGGLSAETATNVELQVANMANLAGVAPAKVFKDIAENAEATSTFFKGDINLLAKQAVEARRMGTSLKENVALAEKLLDFEGNIEEELKAATFVGGEFNLSRARALAYEGKLAEAQQETLSQIQRSGDFRKKDYFTQQQLAKAANMTVEQVNKQLNAQDKLNSLTAEQKKAADDAIAAGLDITNINAEQLDQEVKKFALQQEQQKQMDKISNVFTGLISNIGTGLMPLMEMLASIFGYIGEMISGISGFFGKIGESISGMVGTLGVVGKILKVIAGIAIIIGAYMAYASLAAIPFVGSILGGIAAAAVLAAGFGVLNSIKDGEIASDGGLVVSGQKGTTKLDSEDTFVGNKNGVVAGTDLFGNKKEGGGATAAPQMNLSVLATPLNNMIAEIKALRADMAAGKIAVYMDGQKVTAGVAKQADKSSRNNFAIG